MVVFYLFPLSSSYISILLHKQLGPMVLNCAVNALSSLVFSKPLLDSSVCTMPPWLQFSGTVSLDKDDHFRRGRKSFMSSEESCSPYYDFPMLAWGSYHFEPPDVSDSLCLEAEALELDGMTWAVGRATSGRLGLKGNAPLEAEWSGKKKNAKLVVINRQKTKKEANVKCQNQNLNMVSCTSFSKALHQ